MLKSYGKVDGHTKEDIEYIADEVYITRGRILLRDYSVPAHLAGHVAILNKSEYNTLDACNRLMSSYAWRKGVPKSYHAGIKALIARELVYPDGHSMQGRLTEDGQRAYIAYQGDAFGADMKWTSRPAWIDPVRISPAGAKYTLMMEQTLPACNTMLYRLGARN